jgi:hypothetical protein
VDGDKDESVRFEDLYRALDWPTDPKHRNGHVPLLSRETQAKAAFLGVLDKLSAIGVAHCEWLSLALGDSHLIEGRRGAIGRRLEGLASIVGKGKGGHQRGNEGGAERMRCYCVLWGAALPSFFSSLLLKLI